MDCPWVLGKLRNMREYYCLAQQPDGQQMIFVLPNTLQPEVEGQMSLSKTFYKEESSSALNHHMFSMLCVSTCPPSSKKLLYPLCSYCTTPPLTYNKCDFGIIKKDTGKHSSQ